jgi:hypothetical protein
MRNLLTEKEVSILSHSLHEGRSNGASRKISVSFLILRVAKIPRSLPGDGLTSKIVPKASFKSLSAVTSSIVVGGLKNGIAHGLGKAAQCSNSNEQVRGGLYSGSF